MLHVNKNLLQFDAFELNWNTRQLFREGEPVAVEPKALELIHYLLLHRDRAVGKDELAEALWPNRVISDTVISQTVRKARAAVNDDGERQEVIATVRGYGYRFVADAQIEQGEAPALSPSAPPANRMRALGWMTAIVTTVVLFAMLAIEHRPASAPIRTSIAVTPFDIEGDESLQWLENGIGQMIAAAMGHARDRHVLPYAAVLDQLELTRNEGEAIDLLHSRLGADLVIGGTLEPAGEDWRLQVRLDYADGPGELLTFEGEAPIQLAMMAQRRLLTELGGVAAAPEQFLPEEPWLNETYFRGLQALRDGDAALALRLFDTMLEFRPDHEWSRYQLAVAWRQTGDMAHGRTLLEELLADESLRERDSRLWRVSVSSLGNHYWYDGDMDTALEHYALMAEEGRAAGHALDHAIGLLNQGLVHSNRGNYGNAEDLYAQALGIYSSIGFLPGRARVATVMATLASHRGEPDTQETWNREALEIHRVLGNQRGVAEALYGLGMTAATRMDLPMAIQHLEEARLVARGMRDAQREAKITSLIGLYRASIGQVSRGRALVNEALEQAIDIGYRSVEKDCLGFLGEIELLAGRPENALPWLEQSLAVSTPEAHPEEHLRTLLYRIEALLDLGDDHEARSELERVDAEGWLDTRPARRIRWMIQQAQLAAGVDEDAIRAQAWLQEALTLARNNGLSGMVIAVSVRLGRLHLDHGRSEAVDALLATLPIEGMADPEVLELRAELAWQNGQAERAVEFKRQSRSAYGERWTRDRASRLETFLAYSDD